MLNGYPARRRSAPGAATWAERRQRPDSRGSSPRRRDDPGGGSYSPIAATARGHTERVPDPHQIGESASMPKLIRRWGSVQGPLRGKRARASHPSAEGRSASDCAPGATAIGRVAPVDINDAPGRSRAAAPPLRPEVRLRSKPVRIKRQRSVPVSPKPSGSDVAASRLSFSPVVDQGRSNHRDRGRG